MSVIAIENIESYILDYVSFEDQRLALPLALWTVASGIFESFDAFPYIVITSNTKRAGKTRLSEVLGFLCKHTENSSAMTAATLFRMIDSPNKPTIVFDEAECLTGESASTMRAVLNVGYRKGQTIPRVDKGSDDVRHYPTYCPKIFVLIGDVYDTLRDRSIVFSLKRAEPKKRFRYDVAEDEGKALRTEAAAQLPKLDIIISVYESLQVNYLSDRDAEIWSPILALGSCLLSKERFKQLQMTAVDLCSEKTADRKRYSTLDMFETEAQNDEYARKLLMDMKKVFFEDDSGAYPNPVKKLFTAEVVVRLHALPLAPWRKFRGEGLTANMLADMLSRFGVRPINVRIGKVVARGYTLENVLDGIQSV